MKFNYVIGNPPYQENDGGNGMSATPVYNEFVEAAKSLDPDVLSMIIPSRWFVGGKGLKGFREEMLNDSHMSCLVDYENWKDVFPSLGGLSGGACFFVRDKDHEGPCKVTNATRSKENTMIRNLNEYEYFIRNNDAISIVKHIREKNLEGHYLDEFVSSRKPFGLPTNYMPKDKGVPCWFIQRIGRRYADPKDVDDSKGYLNKWKLLAPKAPIAGQTDFSKRVSIYYESNVLIARAGECCTESFIVLGAFDTEEEVLSFKSYIFTKTVRYLLLQGVVSQDITRKNFCFVPHFGNYFGVYTDDRLRDLWDIADDEWSIIESKIS